MEKKKINLGEVATEASKGVATLFGKTKDALAKAADQTGDGTFDKEDVSVIAENVSTAAKSVAAKAKAFKEDLQTAKELHDLCPIMPEALAQADFPMSSLICLEEMDKHHATSAVCQGSVGHTSNEKGMNVVHIYRGNEALFGVTLYPDNSYDLYYQDPVVAGRYIALDEYFYILKEACVCELEKVAQDLGAKHFRVTYMEEKKTFSNKNVKVNTSAKLGSRSLSGDVDSEHSSSSAIQLRVEAESNFTGSDDPKMPTLCYLGKNLAVMRLIESRLDDRSRAVSKKYKIEFSKSLGIKAKDAANIDGALKSMGFAGNTSVTSEVESASRRYLDYEIEF